MSVVTCLVFIVVTGACDLGHSSRWRHDVHRCWDPWGNILVGKHFHPCPPHRFTNPAVFSGFSGFSPNLGKGSKAMIACTPRVTEFSFCLRETWWEFRPWKKKTPPLPQIPADTLPAPRPPTPSPARPPPPPPGIFNKKPRPPPSWCLGFRLPLPREEKIKTIRNVHQGK